MSRRFPRLTGWNPTRKPACGAVRRHIGLPLVTARAQTSVSLGLPGGLVKPCGKPSVSSDSFSIGRPVKNLLPQSGRPPEARRPRTRQWPSKLPISRQGSVSRAANGDRSPWATMMPPLQTATRRLYRPHRERTAPMRMTLGKLFWGGNRKATPAHFTVILAAFCNRNRRNSSPASPNSA